MEGGVVMDELVEKVTRGAIADGGFYDRRIGRNVLAVEVSPGVTLGDAVTRYLGLRSAFADLLVDYIDAVHQGTGTHPDAAGYEDRAISTWEDAPDNIARYRAILAAVEVDDA